MTTAAPATTIQPRAEAARRALNTVFMVNGAVFATWAVNIPGVRDGLDLTPAQIGVALLASGIGAVTSMSLVGRWIARWGSAPVTRVATVLFLLSLLLPVLAPSLPTLIAALAILGATNGVMDVAMNAQGVTVERTLGRPIMSRLHAYFSLGSLLGAGAGSLLIGRVSIPLHAGLIVATTLLLAAVTLRLLIPDPAGDTPQNDTQTTATPAGPLLTLPVLLLGLLCFLGMLAEGANYDWAALYFRDVLNVPGGAAGLGYAAFVATMTLGRWFGDLGRARLGDEQIVRIGSLVTAIGLAVALLWRDPIPATLGFALSGLGLSNVVPVMYGTAGHALAGRGIAAVAAIGYGGFLLGPPAIGFVADHVGLTWALGIALGSAALITLLGGRAFALIRR
ncbi:MULTISPECIES: MFS transporter [unclassified Deinococcus]|uniref:MFS transporter n=1 Tax=unclassified Deinococcus TaxID=2623546 RepID=UPI001C2F1802|nr:MULTISPECIES: MFS transporter [unclassified Deinococcus]MDK2014541.1 MFS transporter [Deinococcus sp. 43]